MKLTYTAPAKIILSGEHSVVYTKPAFVTAVDFQLAVTIEDSPNRQIDPSAQEGVAYCEVQVKEYLRKNEHTIKDRPYTLTIQSHIPQGRGMGSSAAFCVSVCAALLHFYTGQEFQKEIVNTLAYQSEQLFHGMPSGVDVSAVCFGGLIFYRKEFEFLKTISSLSFKIPDHIQERLVLIDSGKPVETTKEMVKRVGETYNKNPQFTEKTLAEIEKVTKRMVVSTVKEDAPFFHECIRKNQILLCDLGIVSAKTSALITSLEAFGSGKVTGAGGVQDGSGLVLFYCEKNMNTLKRELDRRQITHYPFKQDTVGLRKISQR